MFFDRLFKLQSLKFRLLGSTSFAQLYSAENLSLKKFRREGAMLTPLIAGLLAACGDGGGASIIQSTSPTPTEGVDDDEIDQRGDEIEGSTTFDVVGSEIEGATLYFNLDGEGVLDDSEKTAANRIGVSNEDVVKDFGTGNNKIRVDLDTTQEAAVNGAGNDAAKLTALLAQLKLTITKSNHDGDGDTEDTVITYHGADGVSGGGDDEIVMVLEDYDTALTFTDFDIV